MDNKLMKVEKLTGKKLRDFITTDFGREEKKEKETYSTVLNNDKLNNIVDEIEDILGDEYSCFIGTTNFLAPINDINIKEEEENSELIITKLKTWQDMIRLAESDAVNYNMETEDLIKKITEYDEKYGVSVIQAETDTIVLEFKKLPKNIIDLAKDIYEFCPDVVDQGSGTVETLAQYLEATRQVFLWWD